MVTTLHLDTKQRRLKGEFGAALILIEAFPLKEIQHQRWRSYYFGVVRNCTADDLVVATH